MRRLILSAMCSMALGATATSASAQAFDQGGDALEQAESFYSGDCGKALKGALRRGADDAKTAKKACQTFTTCRNRCRSSKKTANKACKGLKGKKKKACRSSARNLKRSCMTKCRKNAKSKECKRARLGLIRSLRKSAKALAKNPQCKEFAKKTAAAINAASR